MSDKEIVKAALESCPDWEAVRDGNAALERLLAAARAEGFRAARERAIVEVNLEREARDEEEIPAGVVIARIRAMEDAGEDGMVTFDHCPRCEPVRLPRGEVSMREGSPYCNPLPRRLAEAREGRG